MIIDVSSYQGNINWQDLEDWNHKSSDPITGVYIKISQGINSHDPKAYINAQGAKDKHLDFGYYHFATLNKSDVVADATAEANDVLAQLKTLPPANMSLALDIETDELNLPADQVLAWINKFRSFFPSIVLYSGPYFLNQHLPPQHGLGTIPLWLAEYTTGKPLLPQGWSSYWLHQYSDKGQVGGIVGNVDVSRYNK